MKAYRTLITYGTFDLFHVGHVNLLRRLSGMAESVTVGLSSDEFNRIKGKEAVYSYDERREILMACRYVDRVFPEFSWDQKRGDILREAADVFVMGSDWAGKFDDLRDVVEVQYLPRTEGISTTEVKVTISQFYAKPERRS